ncbi:MMPL family transporter [Cellulomonas wangsupingiae]|uniref:MMPL family transporter n=1 Tax=Cellulomonas wangsupingiae TaxID=2968085 RepID=A0ABY5K5M3_9CELL|nr:MMPL family transporter [Cellulomonas wangsupingiae]MCC2335375.1 MMPL family transporter [Cellulomonas wangsupingiae]UUI64447.1 MMPL family transporter [Cellulomonas wangsupingiae]
MSAAPPRTRSVSQIPLRAARWSATHPWWAIGGWVVFVVVCTSLTVLVPTQAMDDDDYRVGESGRAEAWIEEARLTEADHELVLVTAAGGGDLDPGDADAVAQDLGDALAGQEHVAGVGDAVLAPDGAAAMVAIELAVDADDVSGIQGVVDDVAADHPGLVLAQAGDASVDAAIDERVAQDLAGAEAVALPVTVVLMVLAFGALIAAGIPVLLAATSVLATLGIAAALSHVVPAEPTVTSMIALIGMAVGVDYTLFYLKREREERARGRTTVDAVEIAAATSGHSIVVSGVAVVVSLAALYLLQLAMFDSLATGAIVVVAVAVVGSITVLPALLVTLGRWVDRPRVPLLWRIGRRVGPGGVSRRVLGPVTRRPVVAVVAAGLVCGVVAAPALGLRLHGANLDTLPQDLAEVRTLQQVAATFPSDGSTLDVVVRGAADAQDEVAAALDGLARDALASGRFQDPGAPARAVAADGRTHVLTLAVPLAESDPALDDVVRDLRADLVPAALDGLDVETAVGGGPAYQLDYTQRQSERMPFVIGAVLLLTLVMMAASFRSLPVALISTGLNLLSVGVAFGVLRMVFQEGWLAGPLGFTSPGFVIDWIPLFVMVVLVGLSMDYHVFVLSRVRERVQRGVEPRTAVREGIADSAGVVTSAAAVMVSVFAIFATLSMLELKMMGVVLAVAILVDATLVRLVLLPGILTLLGGRVWPRAARRGTPAVQDATGPAVPAPALT